MDCCRCSQRGERHPKSDFKYCLGVERRSEILNSRAISKKKNPRQKERIFFNNNKILTFLFCSFSFAFVQ
jgi:hypothetical protein